MKTIKAGTYRFNNIFKPLWGGWVDIPFTLTTTAKQFGVPLSATCNGIYCSEDKLQYRVISTTPDMSAAGITLPASFVMYAREGYLDAFNGWNTVDFDDGIQTITITEDVDVEEDFYACFMINTGNNIVVYYANEVIAVVPFGGAASLKCSNLMMESNVLIISTPRQDI